MITKILDVHNINEEQFLELLSEIDGKYTDIYNETVEILMENANEYTKLKRELDSKMFQLEKYIDKLTIVDKETDNPELIKINKEIEKLNEQLIDNQKGQLFIDVVSERVDLLEGNIDLLESKLSMMVNDIIYMNEEVIF